MLSRTVLRREEALPRDAFAILFRAASALDIDQELYAEFTLLHQINRKMHPRVNV